MSLAFASQFSDRAYYALAVTDRSTVTGMSLKCVLFCSLGFSIAGLFTFSISILELHTMFLIPSKLIKVQTYLIPSVIGLICLLYVLKVGGSTESLSEASPGQRSGGQNKSRGEEEGQEEPQATQQALRLQPEVLSDSGQEIHGAGVIEFSNSPSVRRLFCILFVTSDMVVSENVMMISWKVNEAIKSAKIKSAKIKAFATVL